MTPDQYQWASGGDESVTSPVPGEGESAEATVAGGKPPAKRKRENRYKNAPPSVLSVSATPTSSSGLCGDGMTRLSDTSSQRRRAQNRASQRAYRERKDQRIKDLEAMLAEQKQKNDALTQAYSMLHNEYVRLRGPQIQARQQPQATPLIQGQPATMPMYDVSGMSYTASGEAMFMYPNMTTDYGT